MDRPDKTFLTQWYHLLIVFEFNAYFNKIYRKKSLKGVIKLKKSLKLGLL